MNIGYVKGFSALGSFDPTDLKGFVSAVVGSAADLLSSDLGNSTSIGCFRMSPYFRWTFYRSGKFELFLDSLIGLNFGAIKTLNGDQIDKTKFTAFEIAARPGVSFALTDNVKLIAKLGGIGYQYAGINDTVTALNRFGLDADPSNLMFGIVYNMSYRLGRK